MNLTRVEMEIWWKYCRGKPCQYHPAKLIKNGEWGNWCGEKDEMGRWCDGGWPTQEWLNNLGEEQKN